MNRFQAFPAALEVIATIIKKNGDTDAHEDYFKTAVHGFLDLCSIPKQSKKYDRSHMYEMLVDMLAWLGYSQHHRMMCHHLADK